MMVNLEKRENLDTYSAPETSLRRSRVDTNSVVPIDENPFLLCVFVHNENVVRADVTVHDARFLEGV